MPVGYEIFPGNTAETKTFQKAIENLSQKFNVLNATVICDRGMLSNENLNFTKTSGMFFIVGEKLKKLSVKNQSIIFDSTNYQDHGDLKIKDIAHPTRAGDRLILVYSPDRAKKDRERFVENLKKKLKKKNNQPKDFVANARVKKYVRMTGGQAILNEEAILNDEKWDGYFGIASNHPSLTAEMILSQ